MSDKPNDFIIRQQYFIDEDGFKHAYVNFYEKEWEKLDLTSGHRAGITTEANIKDRFHGDYYYAKVVHYAYVPSVQKAEDTMLKECKCDYNIQRKSNADNVPGWVYVIKQEHSKLYKEKKKK
jgi:hypothetical protein